MHITSPAKINLFLHTTGRLPNGYHELESLVCFTEWGDDIAIKPSDEMRFEVLGDFLDRLPENGEDNIVMRAVRALQEVAPDAYPVHITLTKRIPIGAGIGGGSSNAATVLRALIDMWNVVVDEGVLSALCKKIGADVPVCFVGLTSYFTGIGEIITPLKKPMPHAYLLMVNPGFEVLTKDIFSERKNAPWSSSVRPFPQGFSDMEALVAFLSICSNDLEPHAESLTPEVGEIIQQITMQDGCRLARMSGSGATCFGLFASEAEAMAGLGKISEVRPDWWMAVSAIRR